MTPLGRLGSAVIACLLGVPGCARDDLAKALIGSAEEIVLAAERHAQRHAERWARAQPPDPDCAEKVQAYEDRWQSAMTYKFVGALDVFIGRTSEVPPPPSCFR